MRASSAKAWSHISDIMNLESWVDGVKTTNQIGESSSGIGARRSILFSDGRVVDEIVTSWQPSKYISYIALDGLGLESYHATLGFEPAGNGVIHLKWQSFYIAKCTRAKFSGISSSINALYSASLSRLQKILES